MKEVESVIHLDEKVQPEPEPKSKFNEYKYVEQTPPPPPPKQHSKQSLKSKLQQNHKRKSQNQNPVRRNLNNQNTQVNANQYYSNIPRNEYQGGPMEPQHNKNQYMSNQPHERENNRMIRNGNANQNMMNNGMRNQPHGGLPQGRVTIPSRYEAQIQQNQEHNDYKNLANNNQAIEDLDEFQPALYAKPNDQQYPMKRNKAPNDFPPPPQEQDPINIEGDISQISLPNVKSNVTLYKNMEQAENSKVQKGTKLVKKEFVFKYNSDKNGLFYFLGTRGGRRDYVNPFELGQIKVFFSSLSNGDYSNFVGRALTNCRTCNEENAFMGVDLGKDR